MNVGILVNYTGLPSSVDSLMPDNGLANLAGSLRAAGWRPLILDYVTTEMIGRLVSPEMRLRTEALYAEYDRVMRSGLQCWGELAGSFQATMRMLEEHAARVRREVADEIVATVKARNAKFVGFKLWTGAGWAGSVEIARRIKECSPDVKLFGGGPHVENFLEKVVEDLCPPFDALALCEGEDTIVDLAEFSLGRKSLREIPGIAYRGEHAEVCKNEVCLIRNLDDLSPPSYDEETYPAIAGDIKLKLFMLDESRGCPYGCNFCFHPVKSGRKWRVRPAKRVVDTMEGIYRATGARTFRLAGSNPPPEHRVAIANELLSRGSPFEYVTFGHTRSGGEDFELLRKSGCISLFYGVESCSQTVLDKGLNKHSTVDQIRNSIGAAKKAGILVTASVIVPSPFETRETLDETLRVLEELRPDGVTVCLPMVLPRTRWYQEPAKFGIELGPDYERKIRHFQVRFVLPPSMWDPLPYSLCGRSYEDMVAVASEFSKDLDARQVVTGLNDSLLLLSKKLDISPMQLREVNRKAFILGDQSCISDLVQRFNAGHRRLESRDSPEAAS